MEYQSSSSVEVGFAVIAACVLGLQIRFRFEKWFSK